jgi:hypothetical protein
VIALHAATGEEREAAIDRLRHMLEATAAIGGYIDRRQAVLATDGDIARTTRNADVPTLRTALTTVINRLTSR